MALVAMSATSTWAYDFSAVAPTGQTLYYNIVQGNAQVVRENTSSPYYNSYPTGDLTIPDSVTFNGFTYEVTSIGSYAFRDCSGLTSVTIPDGVTSIGCDAFSSCSRLTSINIPDGITSIESWVFAACSRLTSVNIPHGVTSIGRYAFIGCSSLTSVNIPNSVTFIGDCAFSQCSRLTSVTISNSITSIGYWVFALCRSLTSVTIPDGVTSIGSYAFYDCDNLTSITIPNSVTKIGDYAFEGCSGLTSVTIGNNVTTIGNHAFERCNSLTSVTIPNSVISIGYGAFQYCSALTSVTIGNGVILICDGTFRYCSGLTSVTIGNGVTWIGTGAFEGCSDLRVMWMKPATPPSLASGSNICDKVIDLVVPHNSYYDYTQAGDKYTRHHIFADSAFVTITINNNAWGYVTGCANDTVFTYPYSDTAEIELVATPYPGYHFVRWDDYTTDSIRTITNIIHDITVKAHFAHDHNNDIDDVETLNAKVYSSQRQIVVEGAEGNMVTLYDVNGRMLTAKQDHDMPLRFDVPVSGTYLVKIGNHPAKKVIVVR